MRTNIPLAVALAIASAGCAATTETHATEQFAVVHATVVAQDHPGTAVDVAPSSCLLAVRYYSRRTDEPGAEPTALARMANLRVIDPSTWIAPAFEVDEAFRGAEYRCVRAPARLAAYGQDSTMFLGESIRMPAATKGAEPRVVRVGFETLASPTPLPGGGVHLKIDAHQLTLLAEDSTDPCRIGSTAVLDLPPGYAAVLRLPQPRE